jgi:hypothetical protein
MRRADRIVAMLLRLYPAAWRREYGSELAEVLSHRPLSVRVVCDVAWNALGQRLRDADPALHLGLAVMAIVATGVAWNILVPVSAGRGLAAVLQDSLKTLPTVVVTPLASALYVLVLVACGCWTQLGLRRSLSECGTAAVRLGAVAGIPVMLVGLLMLTGILHLRVVGPDAAPGTVSDIGLTFTYYTSHAHAPSALAVLTAPLFRLPESWLWGMLGGRLGRAIGRRRQTAAASS